MKTTPMNFNLTLYRDMVLSGATSLSSNSHSRPELQEELYNVLVITQFAVDSHSSETSD